MARQKPEPEQPTGCPDWIVTFSDIVSLLVTFFVLLLTFSTLEVKEFEKLAGSLQGGFGAIAPDFESNRTALMDKNAVRVDRKLDQGSDVPFVRNMEDMEDDLKEMRVKRKRDAELDIKHIEGALRVRIDGDRLFNPNSDQLRPDFSTVVKDLAEILSYYPNDFIVEGHTDATFTGDGDLSRFSAGYELAGSMARKVAEAIIEEGSIPPERVGTASYGAFKPVTDGNTASGRAQNRRVEILILEHKNDKQ
ncbi:MAG: flagellar motor protein MotB [Planctomycetota bacterium]